LLNLIKDAV